MLPLRFLVVRMTALASPTLRHRYHGHALRSSDPLASLRLRYGRTICPKLSAKTICPVCAGRQNEAMPATECMSGGEAEPPTHARELHTLLDKLCSTLIDLDFKGRPL